MSNSTSFISSESKANFILSTQRLLKKIYPKLIQPKE